MKRTAGRLFSAVILLSLPAAAWGMDGSIDATTILRIEQRDNGSQKDTILPATQFLGVDATKLADGRLSLHLYGWGRADLADKSFNSDRADGKLTYGYLQYRFAQANGQVRLGRQFVREGFLNEQVDGLSVRSDLPYGFGVSAFGGASVHTAHIFGENSDGKGDGIAGGRVNYRYRGMLELGASGIYESKAPTLTQHLRGNHRQVGGDLWFSPHKSVEVLGHTSYNTETSHVAEHSYLINIKPVQRLTVTGEFNQQEDRSYLYSWAMFSGVTTNPATPTPTVVNPTFLTPGNDSRNYGGQVAYQVGKAVELSGDYKHYRRSLGDANRFGGDLKLSFLDNAARAGLSYHYLDAGAGFAITPNQSASYHTLRGWAMHDTKTYFGAIDLLDYLFKDKVYGEKSAWEGILSVGYHFTPDLALSGDLSYGRNPFFTEEVRGLLRLTYNTTFSSQGGKK
jgi:hypothetical protein